MDDRSGEGTLQVRALAVDDFSKGFMDLLKQLTSVGEVSNLEFCHRFEEIARTPTSPYYTVVIESEGRIVASGTLLIEKKFIHHCGSVGHIEDVVVDTCMRGHRLGQQIVEFLTQHAREAGCYKVILDCSEEHVGFYEKCGYSRKQTQMAMYFE